MIFIVIDDDEELFTLFSSAVEIILGTTDMSVIWCQNVEELNNFFQKIVQGSKKEYCFIVDYNMPQLRFEDAIECIRLQSQNSKVFVEIIATSGNPHNEDKMIAAGAGRFVGRHDFIKFLMEKKQ